MPQPDKECIRALVETFHKPDGHIERKSEATSRVAIVAENSKRASDTVRSEKSQGRAILSRPSLSFTADQRVKDEQICYRVAVSERVEGGPGSQTGQSQSR